MSAAPRFEFAGAIHHVTNRGTRKLPLFHDDQDRSFFLRRLRDVARQRAWRCLSYCLMGNHIHLVVETLEPTLGAGMRDLESLYARVFNARHGHSGTTIEARYGTRIVQSDEYFAQLLRYVALNPVKAGLAGAPESWRWSSHAALVASRPDGIVDLARVGALLAPWGGPVAGRYGRLFESGHPLAAKYGDVDPATWRPDLAQLLTAGDLVEGVRAARTHGYRLAEISAFLNVAESTVSRWASGRLSPRDR